MRLASFTVVALIPCLAFASRPGRIQPPGFGSAIVLEYSIEPATVGPDQDMTLQLCLTNQNVHSMRDVQPGDAFSFTFGAGVVGACGDVSVFSPDGTFAPDDFACEVLGPVVTLRFNGAHAATWPPGDMACTSVGYHSSASVSNVAATMEIGTRGAFEAASPAFVRLAIGAAAGGGGGAGETRIGQVAYLTSTDIVELRMGGVPQPVPGLATTITVRAGSRLEVHADLLGYACIPIGGGVSPREIVGAYLEVDGFDEARRSWRDHDLDIVVDDPFANHPLSMAWMSAPLAAGPHRFRVMAFLPTDLNGDGFCVGTDPTVDAWNQSRVIIHELLAP
jgi:hypothetical protein